MSSRLFCCFLVSAVMALTLGSCGSKTTRPDGSPKMAAIQFDSTSASLGTFPKSDSRRQTVFTFTNVGDAPLEFAYVEGSCGCITVTYPQKPIKPGKKGEFTVVFNGKNKKPGKVNYRVYGEANIEPAHFILRLSGQMTNG